MTAIKATPRASDLPDPNRGKGGNYSEIEVPGDYEVKLEKYEDYDKTKSGGTRGWKFFYSCETPSGGSVEFPVWIPYDQMWKITQHFDALGSPSEEDTERIFDPKELVGNMAAAHIDFPRDDFGDPTSKYREIRFVFPIPEDGEIETLAEAQPEPVSIPEEVETL